MKAKGRARHYQQTIREMNMGRNTDDKLRGWQSDIIVDLIKRYEFEYIAMQ